MKAFSNEIKSWTFSSLWPGYCLFWLYKRNSIAEDTGNQCSILGRLICWKWRLPNCDKTSGICAVILKRVNLIEIWFYAPSFLVLWHIFFETTAQIPEVKFGGKYGCLRANTDILLNCNYRLKLSWSHILLQYVRFCMSNNS
jgi:hypothetical protein